MVGITDLSGWNKAKKLGKAVGQRISPGHIDYTSTEVKPNRILEYLDCYPRRLSYHLFIQFQYYIACLHKLALRLNIDILGTWKLYTSAQWPFISKG